MTTPRSIGFPRMMKEPAERRVFLPEFIQHLAQQGLPVSVEEGYGSRSGFTFDDYRQGNEQVCLCSHEEAYRQGMVIVLRDNGLINQFIGLIGLQSVNWLGNPNTAMWAIIIMSVWQGVGMQMVLFLAGLQGIPDYLYEASSIDGANAWQNFRYVTLPSLRGVFVFIIITITIAAFQLFTQVWVMTNGGPDDATTTVVFNMVRKGFREQDIAMASAIGVLFFLFIIGISLVQRFVLRDKEA